jgi:hypothetical protein
MCTAVLFGCGPATPTPRIWAHIRGALFVSSDRRHLFVTPYGQSGVKTYDKKGQSRVEFMKKSEELVQPVFLNVYGAQESIPRNEFRQHM